MFISTVISKISTLNYSLETIKKTIIKLPINKKGKPNLNYMENYMKSLYLSVCNAFSKINNL